MGESLFDLEQILRSKQGNLTSEEANVLMSCKAKAIKDFTIGAGAGSSVVWMATRRLSNIIRVNLSVGAAAVFGLWKFGASLDACIEHILSLNGSRMQKELVNILLKKYQNNPQTMRHISKHFYSENVYDDSSSDQPKLMWRYRNFFGDNVANSQRTQGSNSYSQKTDLVKIESEKTQTELKQIVTNHVMDAMENPLDFVLGLPGRIEEIHHPETSSPSPTRHGHSHRRSHRRHRTRRQGASLDYRHSK